MQQISTDSGKNAAFVLRFNSLITCLVSLLINLIILMDYCNSPFTKFLLWDAANYWEWALDISTGNWLGDKAFHQAPFYPYLLSLFISVFGGEVFPIYLFQGILSAITSALICSITNNLTGNRVSGLIAGLIYSFYGLQVFYATKILSECIAAFFSVFTVWLLLSYRRKRTIIAAGISFGILLLIKPHFLISVPFVILFYFLKLKSQGNRILFERCFCFVFPVILIVSLVSIRNYYVEKDFILVSGNGGENFYIGNHEKAKGTYVQIEGVSADIAYQDKDIRDLAIKITGKDMKRSEISKFWFNNGLKFIKNNKLKFLRLQWSKLKNLFSGADLTNMYVLSFEKKNLTRLFSIAFVNIYLLVPLFFAGIIIVIEEWKNYYLILLFLFVNIANIIIFFYDTRFMVIAMPFFILISAVGIVNVFRMFKGNANKSMLFKPVFAALIAGICLLPIMIIRDNKFETHDWRMWMTLGEIKYGFGNYNEALRYFIRSSEMKKTECMPVFGVSKTLYKMGQNELAVQIFKSIFQKVGPDEKRTIMRDRDFDVLRTN